MGEGGKNRERERERERERDLVVIIHIIESVCEWISCERRLN